MTKKDFIELIKDYPEEADFKIKGPSGQLWNIDLKKLYLDNIKEDKTKLIIYIK